MVMSVLALKADCECAGTILGIGTRGGVGGETRETPRRSIPSSRWSIPPRGSAEDLTSQVVPPSQMKWIDRSGRAHLCQDFAEFRKPLVQFEGKLHAEGSGIQRLAAGPGAALGQRRLASRPALSQTAQDSSGSPRLPCGRKPATVRRSAAMEGRARAEGGS